MKKCQFKRNIIKIWLEGRLKHCLDFFGWKLGARKWILDARKTEEKLLLKVSQAKVAYKMLISSQNPCQSRNWKNINLTPGVRVLHSSWKRFHECNREAKHKNYEKYYFLTQKVIKITNALLLFAKHDHFVLHALFAKSVAWNEAHKNHKIPWKNKKLSKSRRLNHFCACILKTEKSLLSSIAKNTKFRHF